MRRRGFTLLEVLISIALIMVLLGSMFAFLLDMLASRRRVVDYTARQLAAGQRGFEIGAGLGRQRAGTDFLLGPYQYSIAEPVRLDQALHERHLIDAGL